LTADATGRRVLAGPVEATAAGNVLTQAVGAGTLDSWSVARETVARSFPLEEYTPRSSEAWEAAYGKLVEMVSSGA
jgi:rhamnulokinase